MQWRFVIQIIGEELPKISSINTLRQIINIYPGFSRFTDNGTLRSKKMLTSFLDEFQIIYINANLLNAYKNNK